MTQDVGHLIRYLLALSGADPGRARIPRGKHRLRVHTQRVGDVRLITVAPAKGALPTVDETALAHLVAAPDTVLLRGIVATAPAVSTLWLVLAGAGAVPLAGVDAETATTLRELVGRPVIVRGACSEAGIVVHAVQAEADV
jgi:hypothetical protein